MNDYDILEAVDRWSHGTHPNLAIAAQAIASLRTAANQNSDGWAYYPKPARSAARLMQLIEGDGTYKYFSPDRDDITAADLKAALRPIKAFRTRSGWTFDIPEVAA